MLLKKIIVYGTVVAAMFFWSATYFWYKEVFKQFDPITVMTFRLGFSSVFLFTFSLIIRKLQRINKSDYLWFILLSFFQPFLYFLAESYGVKLVSPTIAAVIISTIPVFTPFATYLFLGDRLSVFNVFGIVISFIGVLAVILGKNLHFSGDFRGIIYLFIAVFVSLGYAVVIVRLTNKYNSFTIISWQNLIATLFFLPLFFLFDWSSFIQIDITHNTWINIFYLAFFGSSVAFVLFTMSIKNIGITKASMFTNLIPVITVALSYYMLGERLGWIRIAGVFVLLGGLFMSQIPMKDNKN